MRTTTVLLTTLIACSLATRLGSAQDKNFIKNFKQFRNVSLNIDFYAAESSQIAPFEKPIRDARQKLASFLGEDLAKGAIVICSSLEQKDSVNEAKIKKLGYRWVLIQMTPEAMTQQILAQIKAQMGGQVPPAVLERFQNRSPEQKAAGEARLLGGTVLKTCYAILMTTLDPEREFRSSRLDDLARSPLADWLDVGLASYASSGAALNLRYLQEHIEEVFPIEDLLSMPRPFVAPTEGGQGGNSGGGQFVVRMGSEGGPGGGGPPAGGASAGNTGAGGSFPGGNPRGNFNMPKDVQDRMTFDSQAASFFAYVLQKLGMDKARELVQWNREGKLTREFLTRPGYLGPDLDQIEKDWSDWIKTQKPEGPGSIRVTAGGPPAPAGPAQTP